jgi:membrane protein YdbS with pleckstrin-like domain
METARPEVAISPRPRRTILVRRLVSLITAAVGLLLALPLSLLIVVAETRTGRLVGGLAVVVVIAIVAMVGLAWPFGRWRVWTAALGLCALSRSAELF